VNFLRNKHLRSCLQKSFLLLLVISLFIGGCKRDSETNLAEHAYVAVPQVALRDRVATVYNKVGLVNNGDRVRILDRSNNRRFARVRTASGVEGWIEVRYLVNQQIYDQFAALAKANANAPVQSTAIARRMLNMHVQPARDAERLYQIKEGEKLELLKRSTTAKSGLRSLSKAEAKSEEDKLRDKDVDVKEPEEGEIKKPPVPQAAAARKKSAEKRDSNDPMEDWWLVRDNAKRVGWVLGRALDVEVPLEVAQYAEGQRIVAAFVINEVEDEAAGKKVPQYAVLLSEPKDGMPFDYNQLRVFTWNKKRSRYETAFRDRFEGLLPFILSKEDFGKEGVLPVFIARQKDEQGNVIERKYKMNGVIVRRVTAPGEVPVRAAAGRRRHR
jgi:uncharacterized protein YgiM (DUF1202 family)